MVAAPNDYFAVLGQPRRPWLEPDALKATFLAQSSEVHPDRLNAASSGPRDAAHRRYTELNAAYQCLREPKTRVRHLLELELGRPAAVVQDIPPALMEQFLQVGSLCREVDAFVREHPVQASPLLKVQRAQRGLEWDGRLAAAMDRLAAQQAELCAELRGLNAAWDAASAKRGPERTQALPLARLEEIYRWLCFLSRWEQQLRERRLQLAL